MAALSSLLCFVALLQPVASLRTGNGKPLIDKVNFFRCEMCAHQWFDSHAYPKCKLFMTKLCNPGPDGIIDGSPGERTTQHGWCFEFFNRDPSAEGPTVVSSGHGTAAGASAGGAPAPAGAAPAPAAAQTPPKHIDPNDPDAKYIGVI